HPLRGLMLPTYKNIGRLTAGKLTSVDSGPNRDRSGTWQGWSRTFSRDMASTSRKYAAPSSALVTAASARRPIKRRSVDLIFNRQTHRAENTSQKIIIREPRSNLNRNADNVQPLKPQANTTTGLKAASSFKMDGGVQINPRRESRTRFLRSMYRNPERVWISNAPS